MSRSLFTRLLLLPLTVVVVSGCGGTDTGDVVENDGSADDSASSSDGAAASDDAKGGDAATGDTAATGSDTNADSVGIDAGTDTAPPKGPAPVALGVAGNYVMLGQSEVRTVSTSIITGDLGISPATSTGIVGFSLTRAGTFWTSAMVTGKVYAVDNDPPTPELLTTAITNMGTAYTDAAGRPTPDSLNLLGGAIGGSTLVPGLYRWTSSVAIGTDITLSGGANDTWIFQVTGDLTEASAKQVKLIGGARAKNIVWQVAGLVALGTTSHFEGVILCKTGITLQTGATINGRLLAQTAVIIDSSTVTQPSP